MRGYVTTYDAETGRQLWRFYTVPGNPAEGFENNAMEMAAKTWAGEWWKYGGGGTVWNAMTYDPEIQSHLSSAPATASPWNRKLRSPGKGDNLFLCSIVALDADTGEYAWHYQVNPGESWDYNADDGHRAGRPRDRRQAAQGADAGAEERLFLRDRPRDRQADLGGAVRQGHWASEHRPDRPAVPSSSRTSATKLATA